MAYAPAPQISPNGSGDAELVRRARDRDEAAIRAIIKSNNRRLYRLARGILRNDSEAEDVVQETYVRAFTHLDSFRGGSSLGTWLGRIAINEALGRLRRRRAQVEWTSLEGEVLDAQIIPFPAPAASDPEKTMAQRQIQHVVEQAIDELPEPFRIVFMNPRGRRHERGGNCRDSRIEAGDRENAAAPRPRRAPRQCGKENRTPGDGGIPVRRQAMRTPDRGRFETLGVPCLKRNSFELPSRLSLLFCA
jgi:RNA polymerase sigma factor (sigma-70 family)